VKNNDTFIMSSYLKGKNKAINFQSKLPKLIIIISLYGQEMTGAVLQVTGPL